MITEDYVSLETAKLLDTKGFKGEFHKHYWGYEPGKEFLTNSSFNPEYDYPAPTLSMVMKWLRENYNIHIEVRYFPMSNIYRYVIIHSPAAFENIDSHPQYFNTYKEACEAAIKYCLENLI